MTDASVRALRVVSRALMWLVVAGCGHESIATPTDPASTAPGPALSVVSGDAQTGEAGTTLRQPLRVKLRDGAGAPVVGGSVRFLRESGVVDTSALTDANGTAGVTWRLEEVAGNQRVIARSTVRAGTNTIDVEATFTATGLPGPAADIELTTVDSLGLTLAQVDTVFARVTDRFGNSVPAAPVEWSVTRGGGSVRPLAPTTDAGGIARAIFTLGAISGGQVLVAATGEVSDQMTVVAVEGLWATTVAVGANHACALSTFGEAYCWGSNQLGQLGNGTASPAPRVRPGRVTGDHEFTSLVAGVLFTCGLTAVGEAYCWGTHLGGPEGVTVVPQRATALYRYTQLVAGAAHVCGLTTGGSAVCWGAQALGQIGDARDRSTLDAFDPGYVAEGLPVVGNHTFVALAATAYSTCGVTTEQSVFCWGANGMRELGTDRSDNCRMPDDYYSREPWDWPCSSTPVRAEVEERVVSLSASNLGVCGITADARLVCWGHQSLPRVASEISVSAIWVLGNTVCGTTGGPVRCWLTPAWGDTDYRPTEPFGADVSFAWLDGNGGSTCGVSTGPWPHVYCWGPNDEGQVGDGTTEYRPRPVRVSLPR